MSKVAPLQGEENRCHGAGPFTHVYSYIRLSAGAVNSIQQDVYLAPGDSIRIGETDAMYLSTVTLKGLSPQFVLADNDFSNVRTSTMEDLKGIVEMGKNENLQKASAAITTWLKEQQDSTEASKGMPKNSSSWSLSHLQQTTTEKANGRDAREKLSDFFPRIPQCERT